MLPIILSLGISIFMQMHEPRNSALLEKNGIEKYRAARNKVDIQKSITLLYTSNKQVKFEIKTQYLLAPKTIKNLDINLINMHKIVWENYKTLMNKELNNWREIPCS